MFDPDAFSTEFALLEVQPSPEDPEDASPETGPWVSHGTIHTGFKPHH